MKKLIALVCLVFVFGAACSSESEDPEPTPEPTPEFTNPFEAHVFFLDDADNCTSVQWVHRTVEHTPRMGEAFLNKLLEGPTEEEMERGLTTAIPEGAELLSVHVHKARGLAVADFSEELKVSGSCNVRAVTAQISNTLLQFSAVDSVLIKVEGEPNALQP